MEDQIISHKLFEIFQSYKSKQFIFVKPGGNFGDYLIYRGAEKIARLAGINFRSVKHNEFMALDIPQNSIIYIHGGGAWIPAWVERPITQLQKAITSNAKKVIVGPQTFSLDVIFLKHVLAVALKNRKVDDVVVFARDLNSYEVLKSGVQVCLDIYHDHDTALNLAREDLMKYYMPRKHVLYVIREDEEKTGLYLPNPFSNCVDPVFDCVNFDHLVYLHANSKEIITNRLHSAIIGSILDIPTILLPNFYHKNRSVWEYSLKARSIEWQDNLSVNSVMARLYKIELFKRAIFSREFKHMKSLFYHTRLQDFTKTNLFFSNANS